MPREQQSRVVSVDADAALDAALAALGDDLHACTEYDTDEFRVLYAQDQYIDAIGGEDTFQAISEQFHSYINVDFTERRLFEDISRNAGRVNAYVTRMDDVTYARYLFDREGLFFTLAPDADFTALSDAVEDVLGV